MVADVGFSVLGSWIIHFWEGSGYLLFPRDIEPEAEMRVQTEKFPKAPWSHFDCRDIFLNILLICFVGFWASLGIPFGELLWCTKILKEAG